MIRITGSQRSGSTVQGGYASNLKPGDVLLGTLKFDYEVLGGTDLKKPRLWARVGAMGDNHQGGLVALDDPKILYTFQVPNMAGAAQGPRCYGILMNVIAKYEVAE